MAHLKGPGSNATKIDKKLIDYVFDKSKLKQGFFTPGTNISKGSEKYFEMIDYLLILSWNIKKEIINGKNFLVWEVNLLFLPEPKIIN